jgi:hypothetical protein
MNLLPARAELTSRVKYSDKQREMGNMAKNRGKVTDPLCKLCKYGCDRQWKLSFDLVPVDCAHRPIKREAE